ncbi:MAG: L-seryl-tRNA(Sec) selenium transferase [Chloroflexi bacterium]|nr:L-seryl-tRNA(Sec) selenium transferase [Chloroflexota bacterium]MCY3587976.1 L-seryl-tRNA(Sec) selenium transferase [Chloroflexota bacterium]MCY3685666.1 L-seryl-tRNA(Sec) selenium transferase [Chloroflexota bacterium]MDE2708568.1 L-seryl-tRNA(Sec) selenium transferase [Chloroflexota bacterium]
MSNPSDTPSDLSHKLRSLPSVDRVLSEPALSAALEQWPRSQVVDAVRAELDSARALLGNGAATALAPADIAESARHALNGQLQPSLRRVINATGVIIHTNLGRAPVSEAAARAMSEAAAGYSNLEYDLDAGERGSRANHLESLLQSLTGAEAGVAVNNNAAALYFVMAAFCASREVLVSRGQAVEIGGGFRIPDVLRDAGATLVEVGTTNRTRASDYAAVMHSDTAAILRVHSSNFRIVGFTEEPSLAELRKVTDRNTRGLPTLLIDDVGSGCLLDTRQFGLAYEPRPQDSIDAGADLVLFSGDKLLGGPQAGLIIGKQAAVNRLRSHPLMRVLRLDKAAIAGLSVTLQHYLLGEAVETVPIWRMIAADAEQLRERAEQWRAAIGVGEIEPSASAIGGGSLPAETRPTFVWTLTHQHPTNAARQLRDRAVPIITRVEHDRLVLDPRTVLPGEDAEVIAALQQLAGGEA